MSDYTPNAWNIAKQVIYVGIMIGPTDTTMPIETHSNYARCLAAYTHADAGFRAPYLNLYKSRGTQGAPTAVTITGYEQDSIGGINFGGYDGEKYFEACGIYTQTAENWAPYKHGCHISIYVTSKGSNLPNQVIQFGGLDPSDQAAGTGTISTNIISFRPISFGGNKLANPVIYPVNSPGTGVPPRILFKTGDDTAIAAYKGYEETFTGEANPTTTDIPSGYGARWKNTSKGEVRDWVNDGGVMKKSAAYT